MRSFTVFCIAAVLSLTCFSVAVYAQDSLSDLNAEQISEGKKLREEYAAEKEELKIQLQKLIKDRNIAIKDKNTSLVERRNREIKQTQAKMTNLPNQYNNQFSDILTDEQKSSNITDDFYDKELAAEFEKMKKAEIKESESVKPAASKKKPAAKKQPAKKAATKTKK